MTDSEYKTGMDTLAVAARIIMDVDIEALRHVVAQSEVLAPLLEPTAWMRGGADRLTEQRRFLAAAADFKAVCLTFIPAEAES